MAGPWDNYATAQPEPQQGPWAAYQQPEQQPQDSSALDKAGAVAFSAAAGGNVGAGDLMYRMAKQAIMGVPDQIAQIKAVETGQANPDQEAELAAGTALNAVGLGAAEQFGMARPGLVKAIAPAVKEFQDQVIAPGIAKAAQETSPADLVKANELGVLRSDQPQPSLNEVPPQEAGERVMAAARTGDPTATMEPGQQPSPWRQRWEASLDKMATPGDVRRVINGIVDQNDEFAQARLGNMGAAQISQLADVTGLDAAKFDVSATSAKIKTDVEMRNVTEAFRSVTDKIRQAAIAGDPEKFTEAELQRDLLLEGTTATKQLVGLRAEFGRAGNRLQEFYKAQREAQGMKDFYGQNMGVTESDVQDRMKLIADTPPGAVPKVLEATRGQKPGWLFWAWQQGLISGPVTHTKYAEVNTGTVYLERVVVPEIAALVDRARGGNSSLAAPLWANVAMVKAVPDAWRGAVQAFKTNMRVPLKQELDLAARGEENPEALGAKTPYMQSGGPDWGTWKNVFNETQLSAAEKALGIPGRSANALHTFYKILSGDASAASRAMQEAHAEGVTGDDFWRRYQYHLDNPSVENQKGAVDDAYTGAFMEKLGDKSGDLARALRNNPVTKWLFPFQHIPWNIERMTARYAGLGLFDIKGYTQMGQALRGDLGKPAQNLAIARIVTGSTIAGYFVNKGMSGQATGDYPLDQKERRRWSLLNMQPNSVRLGNEWYSVSRLGPVGNLARIGANLGEIVRNYNGQDDHALMKAFGAFGLAIVNQFADETGFETAQNLIDILEGRQNVQRFLAWQAGSFLPYSSFVSQGASFMDPDMRVADTLVDGLRYRIPLLREGLLPKRDAVYGEPIHNPGYHTVFRENPEQIDPIKREMDRVGYYPMPPRKQLAPGVPLDDKQYDEYEATAGPHVKDMLQRHMYDPGYQRLPDSAKAKELRALVAAGRAQGRQAMFAHHPELRQQAIDFAEKASLGH